MKTLYLDTNVMLSKWVLTDPFHEDSKKIINAIQNSKIKGLFSGLGLAEVASVVERQQEKFSGEIEKELKLGTEFIKKITMITNLEICDIIYPINSIIANENKELSIIHWQCFEVASKIHLKTLDNLHIAIITLLEKIKGKKIDYFITSDKEIVSKANQIKKEYGFAVLQPNQLVTLEGL